MKISVTNATDRDASGIAELRTAVAEHLTGKHGPGHWSSCVSEKTVLRSINTSRVLVARNSHRIIGTLRLETKKPWAIDLAYFSQVPRPLYLHDMAVLPDLQGKGIGRRLMEDAKAVAVDWPSDALRLDAYDHPAGAGAFYANCGFRRVGNKIYRGVPLVYYELILEII